MKSLLLVATVAIFLGACEGMAGQSHDHVVDETLSVEERIEASKCRASDTERRDRWLAASKPSWDEYVAGHTANTDDPVENSSVAMAYKAYLDGGQDHEKASDLFDKLREDQQGRYSEFAKCWVQYEE